MALLSYNFLRALVLTHKAHK